MMRKVTTRLPLNIEEAHLPLLSKWTSYNIPDLKVRELHNVFVNHYGLCLKNFLLVNRCAPNLRGRDDKTFWWKYQKLALEQYLVCRYGKSLKSIRCNDEKPIVIHFPWFNYFFWFTECIPRLMRALNDFPDASLIYPEQWDQIPYVTGSLEAFPGLKKSRIPTDHHLFTDRLVMPESRPWSGSIYPEYASMTRDLFHRLVVEKNISTPYGDKIYISRRQTGRRTMANEKEVEQLLSEYGFSIVCMENHSFQEQVNIMRNAKYLVSVHGAGLANLNFLGHEATVLEFVNEAYARMEYTFTFWRLSSALGHKYYMQFCKHVTDPSEPLLQNMNLVADINLLRKNVEAMLSNHKYEN